MLGQWGVREENARERRERRILERDLSGAPYENRRVRPRPRPFGPSPETYVASLGGPLPYMQRLREIERLTAAHESALAEERSRRARSGGELTAAWRTLAGAWRFDEVNDLIARHNRWFPVESPMDPKQGDYALVNGRDYRLRPLDATWVLERFPA